MRHPLISIIIPIYNTEAYLEKCLESVASQSFKDFEAILINDGSKDKSLFLCQSQASQDARFIVIDKENGGVSTARNLGLDRVRGEWIAFIDSDDYIAHDYLENLISRALSYPAADWITSGIQYFNNDIKTKIEIPSDSTQLIRNRDPNGLLEICTQPLVTSPVAKLYKSSIIKKHNIRFDSTQSFGEDRDFNISYIGFCDSCITCNYIGYYYRKGLVTSLSSLRIGNIIEGDFAYWNKLFETFKAKSRMTPSVNIYLANRLYNFIVDGLGNDNLKKESVDCIEKLPNWDFLKSQKKQIQAPEWQKFLILIKWFSLYRIIRKMLK